MSRTSTTSDMSSTSVVSTTNKKRNKTPFANTNKDTSTKGTNVCTLMRATPIAPKTWDVSVTGKKMKTIEKRRHSNDHPTNKYQYFLYGQP
jgi:hypothetical protein